MCRSGQHAIINWLIESNQPATHYNNINRFKFPSIKPNQLNDNLTIFSIEDFYIFSPNQEDIKPIVIIREPKNWMASRIKATLNPDVIQVWLGHANSSLYKIIFDKWFQSEEYRRQICKDLNLNFSDQALNKVVDAGESSFDKFTYHEKAQQMNVLNRWQEYKDHPDMRQVLYNEHVKGAWNKLTN